MTSGVKNASKCRDCSKTIDIGTPAWYNKEGDPGRKVTCQECHVKKYGEEPPPAAAKEGEEADGAKTAKKKQKKLAPKFSHDLLLDPQKGLVSVFKSFPKLKFKGKGHEASDLRRLLNKYAEWAHVLVPEMEFSDFIGRLEKGSNARVREKLDQIRNVVQGFCQIEDIEEYDQQAERDGGMAPHEWMAQAEDGLGDFDGFGESGGFGEGGAAGGGATGGGGLSAEQRERIEANKRLALERAAAKKAAAGAPTADDEDMEMEWAAAQAGAPRPSARPPVAPMGFPDEDEFDAFDEEAEDELFGAPVPASAAFARTPAPAAAGAGGGVQLQFGTKRSAADMEAEAEFEAEMAMEEELEAEARAGPPAELESAQPSIDAEPASEEPRDASARLSFGSDDLTFGETAVDGPSDEGEAAEAAARAAAAAAAMALEAGLDDDEDF